MFEEQYGKELLDFAKKFETKNLRAIYASLSEEDRKTPKLIKAMKALDEKINIKWTMTHYRTASHYLESVLRQLQQQVEVRGKNMHPKYQRNFLPELWSKEELDARVRTRRINKRWEQKN